jgi:hypothetical protein
MVTRVFQLLLLISPICVGTNIDMDMFDITFFRTAAMLLFIVSLFDEPRRQVSKELRFLVVSLLGLAFWNVLIHGFTAEGLHNSMNLFLAVMSFLTVYIYADEKANYGRYVLGAAGINLAFFLSQKAGFDPVWNVYPYRGEEGAFLGNQPRLLTYFALVTPFLPLWGVVVSIFLGLYTKQFVIFIPVALMILMMTKRRYLYLITILLAGWIFRQHAIDSFVYRFNNAWVPALVAFFKQPLIGLGIGIEPINEFEAVGGSFLRFICGIGVMSVAWLYFALKYIRRKLTEVNKESIALVSFVLVSLIEYPVEIPRLWFLIVGIIAFFLIKHGLPQEAPPCLKN